MHYTILDCYTDEPSGLGVPPFLGTYPRYIYGKLLLEGNSVSYITIDDMRFLQRYKEKSEDKAKTNIWIYNRTRDIKPIISKTDVFIVISGVHVPGKYLSAIPGTLREVIDLIKDLPCKKILTGPAATEFGTSVEGGKFAERQDLSIFEEVIPDYVHNYSEIAKASVAGAKIIDEIPYHVIAEIETARGCKKSVPCSFCTEPLKNCFEKRNPKDIVDEVIALNKKGIKHFRLGKQSDFFTIDTTDMEYILKTIRASCDIETLHIDNCDPAMATEEKIKLIVKYCTEGNVAALGVETFDCVVVKANFLNSNPAMALKAIRLINKYGSAKGENGMPKFLPGINIIFGLINESRNTHVENMKYFSSILDEGLLLRRINIRQVAIYKGTAIEKTAGNKFIKKNKKYYWKWRHEIRQKIDNPMLARLAPIGAILKKVRMEVHDGNTTFGRQVGTYPLIIGVTKKLELKKEYNIKVTGHMLRSITGEIVS
ncbi:MAG: radical SAM protein [archaeon]